MASSVDSNHAGTAEGKPAAKKQGPSTAVRRLSHEWTGTLAGLPYDRKTLVPSWVHVGVGAFHRCHQADYLEDLIRIGASDVGVVGVNLRQPRIAPILQPQQGFYTRTLMEGGRQDTRLQGCILDGLDFAQQGEAAFEAMVSGTTKTISFTVTEKGYCHVPATGELDVKHPDIISDLANVQAGQGRPNSVPGLVAAVLAERKRRRSGRVNLLSCDNIPNNGSLLRHVVADFIEAWNPRLAGQLESLATFPSSMVDRIVPATQEADIESLSERLGFRDEAAVFGEPFRQWVLEDTVTATFPRLGLVGVESVACVTGHEHIKMRILNAAQTIVSILGCLGGLAFSHEAISIPTFRQFVIRTLREETMPVLDVVPGMEHNAYLASAISRIENSAIKHRCTQIATDTSQRIGQRILAPLRQRRIQGWDAAGLCTFVGAWFALLLKSQAAFGGNGNSGFSDPLLPNVERFLRGQPIDPAIAGRALLDMTDCSPSAPMAQI
jgi:fructuronate reductase